MWTVLMTCLNCPAAARSGYMKIESEVHHELTVLGEHARQVQVRPGGRGDQQGLQEATCAP